jgi:tetratricopeptide (TPR) repeat protein
LKSYGTKKAKMTTQGAKYMLKAHKGTKADICRWVVCSAFAVIAAEGSHFFTPHFSLTPIAPVAEASATQARNKTTKKPPKTNPQSINKQNAQNAQKSNKAKPFTPVVAASFTSLFAVPSMPSLMLATDFIGRDGNVTNEMNFSQAAAASRAAQIKQTEMDFRLQKPGSEQALQLGQNLIRLYEEQGTYLENIRGLGIADRNYADPKHFVKSLRSSQVSVANTLLTQFSKSELRSKWQSVQLSARMKIGDPTAVREAQVYVRQNSGTDALRVKLTAIAMTATLGQESGPLGTIDSVLNGDIDSQSKAALVLFLAEIRLKSNKKAAYGLFDQAAKEGGSIRTPEGALGPVGLRAAARLIELSLQNTPETVDTELVTQLQSMGLPEMARYYSEKVALNNTARQPQRAIAIYSDILQIGTLAPQVSTRLEFRILDIAVASKDPISTENQWKRISEIGNIMRTPGLDSRVISTQNLLWENVNRQTNAESVERFTRMHDLFVANVAAYAASEEWALRSIDALWKIKRAEETSRRADILAQKTKDTATKLSALRFSARSKETLLGTTAVPTFRGNTLENKELVQSYVTTLESIAPITNAKESEQATFQASFLTHRDISPENGRKKLEAALTKHSRSEFASGAASYLLGSALAARDFGYVEKSARLIEKLNIIPSDKRFKDIRAVVENAVFDQAEQLGTDQKFEAAAQKYLAYQKEFSTRPRADLAFNLAAKNFLDAKKTDLAIGAFEQLFEKYPKSKYAMESKWKAAELSKEISQFLRAANHYEGFVKSFEKEGIKRSAWLQSAEMHKALARYASAIRAYEMHINASTSQNEKVRVAKEIAQMQFKYGKTTEALAAFDRVTKISKNSDDQIWSYSNMIELYLRLNQEGNARSLINRVLELKPLSQDGFKTLAKTKYSLAKLEVRYLKNFDPMSSPTLKKAIEDHLKAYERVKGLFLASCEVPGLETCSVGYYETAKLSEYTAGKLLETEPPSTLNPQEVGPLKNLISTSAKRLSEETQSFAQQAEAALSSGAPDADIADRIRIFAQQQRGQDEGAIQK